MTTRKPTRTERRENVASLLRKDGFDVSDAPDRGDGLLIAGVGYRSIEQAEHLVGIVSGQPAATRAFDPIRDSSREATDLDLAGYLEERMGLKLTTIKELTTALGTDGAAHECWEELVARRRKAGA